MASDIERPRRLVTLQRDGADFVVSFYPEDIVTFSEFEQKGSVATWFGRKDELLALIGAAHDTQIQVYADFVIDHCSGADAQEISPIDGVSRWITLCVCQ